MTSEPPIEKLVAPEGPPIHFAAACRMVKIHDKVSGTFHSLDVAKAFAHIRSYIQTAANSGLNRLDVLRQLFTDGPWIPPPRPART